MDNDQNTPTEVNTQYQGYTYISEEERLKKFMSRPKFLAARELMASPLCLMYAISITVMLLIYFIGMHSFIHPFLILLCYAGWSTYLYANKSKKNNTLPNANGLGLASVISTIMMALMILTAIFFLIFVVGSFASYYSIDMIYDTLVYSGIDIAESDFKAILCIVLIFGAIVIILGIIYYKTLAQNLKSIKFCITNEDDPKRISTFPAVFALVVAILGIVVFIADGVLLDGVDFNNPSYLQALKENELDTGITGFLLEYVESQTEISPVVGILSELAGLFNSVVLSLFLFKAVKLINPLDKEA